VHQEAVVAPLNTPIEFVSTFTRYAGTEVIGEGGTGRVYKATSEAGDILAIKVLDPARASKDRRRRFQNELTFGLRNEHKNVLTVLDHGPIRLAGNDTSFYVMPLYVCSLRKLLQTKIPKTTALPLFTQILDGVEAAHLQDIVHRDPKPENILFDSKDNRLVVADFGIADFSRRTCTRPLRRMTGHALRTLSTQPLSSGFGEGTQRSPRTSLRLG